MIIVISPSKTLDFETKPRIATHTVPEFLGESQQLIKKLRTYSVDNLSKLMDISEKLSVLNWNRFRDFTAPFTPDNSRQALLAFKGDVYEPIEVELFHTKEFEFAQKHLRILSGMYGLLKPLDLIQPYRLEMGIRLPNPRGKDLYAIWGDRITEALNEAMAKDKSKLLVNLASEEYFKAVRPKKLEGECLNIVFKENQKGKLKIIGLFAKKARGMMVNFIIKNQIINKNDLKKFTEGGYRFEPGLSNSNSWVFVR